MSSSVLKKIDEACVMTREGNYLHALTAFLDVYGTDDMPPLSNPKAANASFFGLCLALVQKKYKPAVDLCRRAIDLEFYNGDHYANLARVYSAAGNRKKAIESAEAGLKIVPDHEELQKARRELGVRSRPAMPFLDRAHPINVTLGQSRHAKKIAENEQKRSTSGKAAPARRPPTRGGKAR